MTSNKLKTAFDSPLPVEEAVRCLARALVPFRTWSPLRQGLVGSVTPTKVRLRYSGPFSLDSGLKFLGSFEAREGSSTLRGRFARPYVSLALEWIFFLIFVLNLVLTLASSAMQYVSKSGVYGFLLCGSVVLLHAYFERTDRRRINKAISEVLRIGERSPDPQPSSQSEDR